MIEQATRDARTDDPHIIVGAATDAGGRAGNEDTVHVGELPARPADDGRAAAGFVLAVADGMGGHQRGEVASRLAIDTVVQTLDSGHGDDAALLLKQAFRRANDAIYAGDSDAGDEQRMGTTLVVAVIRGKYATIGSVGDSRAYLVRANALTQITKDHSLVADQVSRGELSATEARQSPQRNVLTHALGHRAKLDGKMPGIFELTLLPEDRLLLCSDGFYDVVSDDDFVQALLQLPPDESARRLVDLAVERGTTDNVSAVIAQAIPTRVVTVDRELVAAPAGRGSFGGPVVIIISGILLIVIFVAIVLLTLTGI